MLQMVAMGPIASSIGGAGLASASGAGFGTLAATGLSIGGSLLSGLGGLSANKQAKKAAQRQAEFTFAQRKMERRQSRREYDKIIGENRARSFASNLQPTGSTAAVMRDIEGEFLRDLSERYNAALAERTAIRAGGKGSDAAVLAGTALNIGSSLIGLG